MDRNLCLQLKKHFQCKWHEKGFQEISDSSKHSEKQQSLAKKNCLQIISSRSCRTVQFISSCRTLHQHGIRISKSTLDIHVSSILSVFDDDLLAAGFIQFPEHTHLDLSLLIAQNTLMKARSSDVVITSTLPFLLSFSSYFRVQNMLWPITDKR